MSEIPLYNVLTKLGANPEEAKEALSEVANSKNVATKADLRVGLAEQETKLIEKISDAKNTVIVWEVGVGVALFLGLSAVILTVVDLLK